MNNNYLIFDIETIPDTITGPKIYDFTPDLNLSQEQVGQAMMQAQREKTGGNDFLPLFLQRIVTISVLLHTDKGPKIWSLSQESGENNEAEILARFFKGIETYKPVLVSWNGTGFDLPVLHYRSLLHNIQAPSYWDIGDLDRDMRWNNYLSRYHWKHIDVMDVLSSYQARATASLQNIAVMLGLPGKLGLAGDQVGAAFWAQEYAKIKNYCEIDVLNTYLIFLQFQFLRGHLDPATLQQHKDNLRQYLGSQNHPHWQEFLGLWSF